MISFTGFHENMVTFACDDTVKVGTPVVVSGNATVTKAPNGAMFCGVARSVRDGYACVQMSGYMRLSYSGTVPVYGLTEINADNYGGIKPGTGRTVIVVEVDTEARECGFIL